MFQVTSTDIQQWASTRASQSQLPDLVRRLILTTIDYRDIDNIAFPCGDDISNPGYDGVLATRSSNPYVPVGNSVWEMSVQEDTKRKADSDYQKRTADNPNREATFIFVTARKWSNKEAWASEKTAEGAWKEVRVYDATDLELWLLSSFPAKLWFLELIGRYDNNIETLESYSKRWMSSFKIELPLEIASVGRETSITSMHSFLLSENQTQRISSITKDESVIFLYAAILALSDAKSRNALLSKTVVVRAKESLGHPDIESNQGLIIVPVFNNIQGLEYKKGFRYIVPLDPSNLFESSAVPLSRIGTQALSQQLEKAGLSKSKSGLLAKNSGGRLSILRRLMDPICLPEWAQNDQSGIRQVIPIMLAQYWDTKYSGDSEMISRLAGMTSNKYENILTLLLNLPDSPVIKTGSLWCVNSALDCYLSFMSYISKSDWEEFQKVVLTVLTDRDPALDIEPEKRWSAALYNKTWKFSKEFRSGLAQSLILISIFGERSGTFPLSNHSQYIDHIVKQVLTGADRELWYSLGEVLPLLAEASPRAFMQAVESSLSSEEKHIMGVFVESDDVLFSSSKHHHLLWALEALAWDTNYFKRSVKALCDLSQLDPGGKTSNRPFNSLICIFRLWMPQTEVSFAVRFKVLKEITIAYPDVGWDLLVSLLPKSHDMGSYSYRYKWRELSCQSDSKITTSELFESVCETVDLILPMSGTSADRWVKLIESYTYLPKKCQESLLTYFNSRISEVEDKDSHIANKLRCIISRHRRNKSAQWAMTEADIKPLEDLYKQLEPTSVARFKYLFNDCYPYLIDGRSSRKDDGAYLDQLRNTAIEDITQEYGLSGIFELSRIVSSPTIIANSVPLKFITENLNLILENLDSKCSREVSFCQKLLRRGCENHGKNWAENIITDTINDNWNHNKFVNLLLSFPSERWLWSLVEATDHVVQIEYWQRAQVFHHGKPTDDIQYAVGRLLHSRRSCSALRLAHSAERNLPVTYVAQVLEIAATTICSEPGDTAIRYFIAGLIESVQSSQEIERAVKMKIEGLYLSLLTSLDDTNGPKTLHEEMSNDPRFFVHVLSMTCKPRIDDNTQEDKDSTKEPKKTSIDGAARVALDLLFSWQLIPGKTPEGSIDASRLIQWIDEVIELTKEQDYHKIALCRIGNVLSYSTGEADGQWPCNSVCEVLEYYSDTQIDQNFIIGVFNQRGTFSRDLFEGGTQERTLARKYRRYASQVMGTYPRVSDILNEIADEYELDAKRADEEAEKNRIEYG
ncbi:MAG TPA: hypothetical protein GX398_06965 [Candidatus Cloacimonetes bacterium]|nr:hypothetical protein [Candidatus Cloacimonadota bacterium]